MRVSFYVMAVAALGASEVLSVELTSGSHSGYKHLNPLENDELDLAQELIQPEDGHTGIAGMEAAQVGTDSEFIGGLMSSVSGAVGNVFGGRKGHH